MAKTKTKKTTTRKTTTVKNKIGPHNNAYCASQVESLKDKVIATSSCSSCTIVAPKNISRNAKKYSFKINEESVVGFEGEKVIDVAKRYGIDIPHLCMHPRLDRIGACRLCIVQDDSGKVVASCTTPVREGATFKTHTPEVLEDRSIALELILANHNYECVTCPANLHCKLQKYSYEMGIETLRFKGAKRPTEIDTSSVSIKRDTSKCILCTRCVRMCNDIQSVHAIGVQNRGFDSKVAPPLGLTMSESACVNCGQCVVVCPTGALSEHSNLDVVIGALSSGKHVIAQTAPSIRASLGEEFGFPVGTPVTGKMVAALKEMGFDKVFDTDLAADITIVEEATEFVKRLKSKKDLPMITTCCPAWIKFAEQFFFEQLNHMSSCRSPQAMMASLIKTWYAKKNKIKSEDIVLVDIMPCTAKKFEIQRPEFAGEADYVITTVELARLIRQFNIDFNNLPDCNFDNPLGESSGASVIFGRTGGVMEAALRTAADYVSSKDLKSIEYTKVRGLPTLKEATVTIDGHEVKIAVAHTLGEARKIMEAIRTGESPYHFIEIMACYGGCVGGGGQPRYDDEEVLLARAKALNKEDKSKKIRKSHKNPAVIKLYKEYLGKPGGAKAHKLLHTSYVERDVM